MSTLIVSFEESCKSSVKKYNSCLTLDRDQRYEALPLEAIF